LRKNLKGRGIQVISGWFLKIPGFIEWLEEKANESEWDLDLFFKQHGIYVFRNPVNLMSNFRDLEPELQSLLMKEAKDKLDDLFKGLKTKAKLKDVLDYFTPIMAAFIYSWVSRNPNHLNNFMTGRNSLHLRALGEYLREAEVETPPVLGFLAALTETGDRLFKISGNPDSFDPLWDNNALDWALDYSPQGANYFLEKIWALWDEVGRVGDPSVFFEFAIKYLRDSMNDFPLGSWTESLIQTQFDAIDHEIETNPEWARIMDLFIYLNSHRLIMNSKEYKVEYLEALSGGVGSGEQSGKNEIVKVTFQAQDGEKKTVLFKWVGFDSAQNDLIATRMTREFLGERSYRVSIIKTYPGPSRTEALEMIEMIPANFIAQTSRIRTFNPVGVEEFLSGPREKILERLQQYGAILAMEYFGALDCKMRHKLFDRETKTPFRIDWEYMFFKIDNPPPGVNLHILDIPGVLEGDDREFLKLLMQRPEGLAYVEAVIEGFDEAVGKFQGDLMLGEDSRVMSIIRSVVKDSGRFDSIQTYVMGQFFEESGQPKSLNTIKDSLGLVPSQYLDRKGFAGSSGESPVFEKELNNLLIPPIEDQRSLMMGLLNLFASEALSLDVGRNWVDRPAPEFLDKKKVQEMAIQAIAAWAKQSPEKEEIVRQQLPALALALCAYSRADFMDFVRSVNIILDETKTQSSATIVSWADSEIRARDLINEFLKDAETETQRRLILGTRNSPQWMEALKMDSRIGKLIQEGRILFLTGEDSMTVSKFLQTIKQMPGMSGVRLTLILVQGTAFPENFFDLTDLEWKALQEEVVYFVDKTLRTAVAIDKSLIPDWKEFMSRLIQA